MTMLPRLRFPILALLLAFSPAPSSGQAALPLDRELRVFFDCEEWICDHDYLIEQIGWVDFVTDRQVADVHVLVTEQTTAGGGEEYTLRFIGRGALEGRETTVRQVAPADATDDDERRLLVRGAQLGLAPFASETPVASRLTIALAATEDGATEATPADDPWHGWAFAVSLSTFMNGESAYRYMNGHGSFSASRTTADWKESISVSGSRNAEAFEIDDSTTIESERENYGARTLVVRSLSDHWSVGGHGSWSRDTYQNYQASVTGGPAIEFSFFPYTESTSRLLTLLYTIGPRYYDYTETTIFGMRTEAIVQHRLSLNYDATQEWGSIDMGASASHYIASLDGESEWDKPKYNLSIGGGAEVRLFRGLSLRMDGYTEMVRDQIELPAGDRTPEEILVQRRQLATGYYYFGSFGFTYRFGSIFSPVVNPRFPSM